MHVFSARTFFLAEALLLFVAFFLYGAYTVPDVNEAHYLGKAAHFWNPEIVQGDYFLDSPDAHQVFYFTLGWMTLFMPLPCVAWTFRILGWFLLALGWTSMVRSFLMSIMKAQNIFPHVFPPRSATDTGERSLLAEDVPVGYALLTGILFTFLMQHFNLAGEWVVGGAEAKVFSYALIFFGLGQIFSGRWNTGIIFLGLASAFHVLVGGWVILSLALAWGTMYVRGESGVPSFRSLLPGLLVGFILSLTSLVPTLGLNAGASAKEIQLANIIYVYERLPHHLVIMSITQQSPVRVFLFGLLVVFWNFIAHRSRLSVADSTLRATVYGAIFIALMGVVLGVITPLCRNFSAGLLRFYWFRVADVMVPLGVAVLSVIQLGLLCDTRLNPLLRFRVGHSEIEDEMKMTKKQLKRTGKIAEKARKNLPFTRVVMVALCLLALYHVGSSVVRVSVPRPPRSCAGAAKYAAWRDICDAAHSGTEPTDVFMVPYNTRTFTWYSRRPVVTDWKDVPQDAKHLLGWWKRMTACHYGWHILSEQEPPQWGRQKTFSEVGKARLSQVGKIFGAKYLLTTRKDVLDMAVFYQNDEFTIYRLPTVGDGDRQENVRKMINKKDESGVGETR